MRVSKRTGHIIPKPAFERLVPRSIGHFFYYLLFAVYSILFFDAVTGPKDTLEEDVLQVTYENYEKLFSIIYGPSNKSSSENE